MIELIENRAKELAELCRTHHVRTLEVFGSAANGKFDPATSDLDFLVEFAELKPGPMDWTKVLPAFVATFAGMLWFVAVREEFLFRGMLQPLLARVMGNRAAEAVTR